MGTGATNDRKVACVAGLREGTRVTLGAAGTEYIVGQTLGVGGQGAVYRLTSPSGKQPLAAKWYHPAAASPTQRQRVEHLIARGLPSSVFLWPIDLITATDDPGFGYAMPLRDARLVPLAVLMAARKRLRLAAVCAAAEQLADAFLALHALGLCYADISFGNVFLDPASGAVQICDNDNVGVDGAGTDVLGTPYFMAPEVVRGEAAPSMATDRFSLAVLLFCLLTRHHPLLGAREQRIENLDATSLTTLLGKDPVFVFDPDNKSNRPVPGVHDNVVVIWPALPRFVRRLFLRSFTVGLRDARSGRVAESEWRRCMRRLRHLTLQCPLCGAEQFFDPERPDGQRCAAPDCGKPLGRPALLEAGTTIVLQPGRVIWADDLTPTQTGGVGPVAEVLLNARTKALGLRNTADSAWTLLRADMPPTTIAPGQAIVVRNGMRLAIGELTCTLVV
jgi:DNA-binding helix-hairpin-helix protein with protein kinase domain